MSSPAIHALLPASGAIPEMVVRSLQSLRRISCPVLYIHSQDEVSPVGPDVISVVCDSKIIGEMFNAGVETRSSDLYLWVPPGVHVFPGAIDSFKNAFRKHPESSLFVSDYELESQRIDILPLRDDLTEREDYGLIWGIPAWALKKIGGIDSTLNFSAFYDLRLKLSEIGTITHIHDALCQIPQEETNDATADDVLFFPGRGQFGGFSYLFMDPEEEREVEEVFYRCLKRRGAYLESVNSLVDESKHPRNAPLVTVLIPVYNRARYISAAIESVLKGTFQDFEIIIIDNASTDNTIHVVQDYVKADARIRLLHNDVNLIAKALNKGVRASKGKYIAQLDSDDEYLENTLEDMISHLEDHPACGLAISYYDLMDEFGKILVDFGIIKHLEYNLNNILRVDGAGAVRVWRKSAIQRFGGFNENDYPNYGEDYDLVLKVSEVYDIDRVHKVCYHYRRHPGNTDALRRNEDKIKAKTLARSRALERRREMNAIGKQSEVL